MSEVAEFPTLDIMTMVFGFKAAQLFVTFGAQVAILVIVGHYDNTFGILAILNITFSLRTLFFRGWDMAVKHGVLRNTAKSDDCDAARQAAGTERAPSPSAVVDNNVELGTLYTENPLHGGQAVVPNSHVDAGDSDTLLASMQAKVEEQVQRAQQQDTTMGQMRDALEVLTRRINVVEQSREL